jgi:hypothetical protein
LDPLEEQEGNRISRHGKRKNWDSSLDLAISRVVQPSDKKPGSTIELDNSFDDTSRRFVRRIQESEVKEALKRMKGGKAMGPDCIPIEVWRGSET